MSTMLSTQGILLHTYKVLGSVAPPSAEAQGGKEVMRSTKSLPPVRPPKIRYDYT